MSVKYPQTLCWDCAKALGKCSWSNGKFEPVEGWKAIATKIKTSNTINNDSYCVLECPEFEKGLGVDWDLENI